MGKDGRPVKNVSVPVTVQFGLGLIKMELKEKENVLVMSTWSRMVSKRRFYRVLKVGLLLIAIPKTKRQYFTCFFMLVSL